MNLFIRSFFIPIAIFLLSAPALAVTNYYVDPDWTGSATGAVSTPWTSLTTSAWTTINNALVTDDVTVFFSARESASDTNEATTLSYTIQRTDTSIHRLVLDGMSKYNTNDSNPDWTNYSGSSRFQITSAYPVSTGQNVKRNYVTVRGFKIVSTNGQGIYYWGGDHVIIEYCDISHTSSTTHGPGMYFEYARRSTNTENPCVPDNQHNCGVTDITIRNNAIHDTFGEALYIGGVYNLNFPSHSNITIENNTVYDAGRFGGEGDGIETKDGMSGVTIRGNTVYQSVAATGEDCITVSSAAVIERNYLYNCGRNGITLSAYWNAYPGRNGGVIRNNVIVNNGGNSAYSWDNGIIVEGSGSGDQYTNVKILNNTIYNTRDDGTNDGNGINIMSGATNVSVMNNISFNNMGFEFYADSGTLSSHDYNLFFSSAGEVARYGSSTFLPSTIIAFEAHSLAMDPMFINTSEPFIVENFRLSSGSPAIGNGTESSDVVIDYFGNPRSSMGGMDLGAIKFKTPSSPSNLLIMP